MADATFDGENLIITLPNQAEVNVEQDIYSPWKEWFKTGNNSRYPLAFRESVGGDPLTGALNAGSYFFLQNQNGWRVKPPEADVTINLIGSLVPEDTSIEAVTPTDGAFTVLILGLQDITQEADIGKQLVEGTRTVRQAMRIMLAGSAGDVTVPETLPGTLTITDPETGAKTRITATVDADGNRTVTAIDDS